MRYLIVSDIHGCYPSLEKVLSFYDKNGYDMLLILGDILNFGPRNGVPEGLDAPAVAAALSARAKDIVAVRGNCDSEVDQMLLHFPMMSDSAMVVDDGKRIFLTHGHVFNEAKLPVTGHDVLIYGHTHLQKLERLEDGDEYYNDLELSEDRSFTSYLAFTEADARRLDRVKGALFNCFGAQSVANASFQMRKARQTPLFVFLYVIQFILC